MKSHITVLATIILALFAALLTFGQKSPGLFPPLPTPTACAVETVTNDDIYDALKRKSIEGCTEINFHKTSAGFTVYGLK